MKGGLLGRCSLTAVLLHGAVLFGAPIIIDSPAGTSVDWSPDSPAGVTSIVYTFPTGGPFAGALLSLPLTAPGSANVVVTATAVPGGSIEFQSCTPSPLVVGPSGAPRLECLFAVPQIAPSPFIVSVSCTNCSPENLLFLNRPLNLSETSNAFLVTPISPVPEPDTLAVGLLLIGAAACLRNRYGMPDPRRASRPRWPSR